MGLLGRKKKYDHVLLLAVLSLLLVGIVMMMSIGVPKSIKITADPELLYPDCADTGVDCYYLFKNHVERVLVGFLGLLFAWKVPFSFWRKLTPYLFGLAVFLLLIVLLKGDKNGTFAQSWLNLPLIPVADSLQPSEIAKFTLVLYLAHFFTEKITPKQMDDWKEGFLKFVVLSGVIIFPVMLQPDLGSSVVLAVIAASLYILAGARWRHIGAGVLIAGVMGILLLATVGRVQERFESLFNEDPDCTEDVCWQSRMAEIAVGSGGFWGKGLTQGIQKQYWLPQASDDFIFAASAEELGFIKMAGIVFLFTLIGYRGYVIAMHAPGPYMMLIAAGLTTWLTLQSFINIMVNIGLFPITGITLPFLSYGGSSMVMTLVGVGVLLNISQYTTDHASPSYWRRNSRSHRSQSSHRRSPWRSY